MRQPPVALLEINARDSKARLDRDQLQGALEADPDAIIVYNQQADATTLAKSLVVSPAQVKFEIRQETKGVLGLQA